MLNDVFSREFILSCCFFFNNRRVVNFTDYVKFYNPNLVLNDFLLWITKHLKAYPFGLRHCLHSGYEYSLLTNGSKLYLSKYNFLFALIFLEMSLRRVQISHKSKLICNYNEDIAGCELN